MTSDVASSIWRAKFWLLVAVIAAVLMGYVVSSAQTPRYTATAVLQVISGRQASGEFVGNDELLSLTNVFARVARTRAVEAAAIAIEPDARELIADVTVTAEPDVTVLRVTAEGAAPVPAATAANAYAEAVVESVAEQQAEVRAGDVFRLEERIEQVQRRTDEESGPTAELEALQTKLAERLARSEDAIRILESAATPTAPSSPDPVRDAMLAAIAVLIGALLFLYVRTVTSARFVSSADIARSLGLPVIGEIPRAKPGSAEEEEAFRTLRTSLDFGLQAHDRPVLLFTSAEPSSGKTHVSANVALSFAGEGRRVVAVDSDLRRPSLHGRLDVRLEPGLGDVLAVERSGMADLHVAPSGRRARGRSSGSLDVVSAGTGVVDPAAALSSQRMSQTVDSLRRAYDLVVLDSPPLLGAADALVLSRYAVGVVLIVDRRRDRRGATEQAVDMLRSVDAPILGVVYNGATQRRRAYGYGNRGGLAPTSVPAPARRGSPSGRTASPPGGDARGGSRTDGRADGPTAPDGEVAPLPTPR